ncbi:MAG: ABC transporter permease [bacterium]|nr:ABC transporter permease [bacterium]MCY4103402.1 ABC transporter permease [bacterium]
MDAGTTTQTSEPTESVAVAAGDEAYHSTAERAAQRARLLGPPAAVAAGVIGIWYLFTYFVLDRDQQFFLPPLHRVVDVGFLTWDNLEQVLLGLWRTTQVTLVGLALAIVGGMAIAVVMSQARWIERSVFPYAVAVQAVPIVAISPLIGLWWGWDFQSQVVVTIIISIFPIITNTLFGLRSVEPSMHDLLTLHRVGRWTRFRKLQLPHALPAIFTGFRISAGLAVVGAIVGEFFFKGGTYGTEGLGQLLFLFQNQLSGSKLVAGIIFSSLLGVVLFWFFGWAGRRLTSHWYSA